MQNWVRASSAVENAGLDRAAYGASARETMRVALEKWGGGGILVAMNEPGKMLFIIGLMIAAVGLLIWMGFGRGWLGRLPGDIHYTSTRGNFSFYFPIVTCLLSSAILALLLWLFRK